MARPRKAAAKKSVKKSVKKAGGRVRASTAKQQDAMTNVSAEIARVKEQLVLSGEKLVEAVGKRVQQVKQKLDKAAAKQKTAKDRRVAANKRAKAKGTAAAEQQLEKARTAYETALAEAETLRKEYEASKAQLRDIKEENAKATALAKAIDSFEKKWEAKVAKARKKTASTGRRRGRPRKSAAAKKSAG